MYTEVQLKVNVELRSFKSDFVMEYSLETHQWASNIEKSDVFQSLLKV